MANQFISIQDIARSALPILRNNLIFPALAYTDYSNDFSKKGDTVQVKKPPVYVADEFSSQITVQDVKEESVLVKLDKIADVDRQGDGAEPGGFFKAGHRTCGGCPCGKNKCRRTGAV